MAGGGRLKEFSVAEIGDTSWQWISVEAAGVGGKFVRGMIGRRLRINNHKAACRVPRITGKRNEWG